VARIVLICALLPAFAACGSAAKSDRLQVVASTNVYGDVISQIGGSHVAVTSILTDPNADPHLFEPGTSNGLAISRASVVVQNGLGYDDFMTKLERAAPNSQRHVLVVADVIPHSSNPHLWYDLPRMPQVAAAIARRLSAADPRHADAYRAGERRFVAALAPALAALRALPAGTPVAYTEQVPGYLVRDAGLRNLTPPSFAVQIEEGNEPSAAALSAMNALLARHKVRALLYNSQAVSPVTSQLRKLAVRESVAVVPFTETLPLHLTFEQWQLRQIDTLKKALA
jgi:zinc/manganese transport system substrate-binding protein